jgi:hypothetical protein
VEDLRRKYFLLDMIFFNIGITHVPTRTPRESYNIVLWNWEGNHYKEVPIPFGDMMKRK